MIDVETLSGAAPHVEPAPVPTRRRAGLTVVVPVAERPEPLAPLYDEYAAALRRRGWDAEFVFVAPHYFAELTAPLEELGEQGERVRVIHVGRNVGETGLLRIALSERVAEIVVTAPPYRQVEASALADVVERVAGGADFAVARRWPRQDPLINRAQHRVLHGMIDGLSGGRVHDIGCGVRAMRRDLLQAIPLYGDFARFLPLLALHAGFVVEEVPATQHPHDQRRRVYAPGVYLRRAIDVLGLFFLLRFTDKPLRFFGLIGALLGAAGAVLLSVLFVQRIGGEGVADRPMLVLAVLLVTLGVQSVALGLIGEMIVHFHAARMRRYRLRGDGTRP
ncbi:MAG TPA: hypothetical protein VNA89_01975 [Gemmatimonadaceae bacterium]|nr:hypothetical protein [Gemmatimonadaceae bacterium]